MKTPSDSSTPESRTLASDERLHQTGLRFVVGYDASAPSGRAVRLALSLASATQGRVWVVHALNPDTKVVAEPLTEEAMEAEVDGVRSALRHVEERATAESIPLVTWVREGGPAKAVLAAAEEVGADLILVGTRGLRGAAPLFLGSVSREIITHSVRPVTVVP